MPCLALSSFAFRGCLSLSLSLSFSLFCFVDSVCLEHRPIDMYTISLFSVSPFAFARSCLLHACCCCLCVQMGSCLSKPPVNDAVTPLSIVVSVADDVPPIQPHRPRFDAQTQTSSDCLLCAYDPVLLYNAALLHPRRSVAATRWSVMHDYTDQSPSVFVPRRRVLSPTPQRAIGRASLEHLSRSAESPPPSWMMDANSSPSSVEQ